MTDNLAVRFVLAMLIVLFHAVPPIVHGGDFASVNSKSREVKLNLSQWHCHKLPNRSREILTCGVTGSSTATSAGGLDELETIGQQHRKRSRSGDLILMTSTRSWRCDGATLSFRSWCNLGAARVQCV